MMPRKAYSQPTLKELKILKQNSKTLMPSSMTSKDFRHATLHVVCDNAVFKTALKNKIFGINQVKEVLKGWKVERMGTDVIVAALGRAVENKFIAKEGKQWKTLF